MLLGKLSISGTLKDNKVGFSMESDSVGVSDVESHFLSRALRAKNDLINRDKADHELTIMVATEMAAKSITSNTPDTCFLQFLLRLTVSTLFWDELAGAFVLRLYDDQSSNSNFNHSASIAETQNSVNN